MGSLQAIAVEIEAADARLPLLILMVAGEGLEHSTSGL